MKRVLSLILAATLIASLFAACHTTPEETTATESAAPEGEVNHRLITENGVARAHIVLADGADETLAFAAEELAYHVELVSGAALPMVTEAASDGLSIVIATPETHPALAELFSEDIAWLSTTEEDGKEYGSDGFAIRSSNGVLYIFGATSRGALNGVYDFIEDNLGVLWIRTEAKNGTIYNEMPTLAVTKTDYREKSPFEMRGWFFASEENTNLLFSRNKLNAAANDTAGIVGMNAYRWEHNVQELVQESPLYDPNETAYWNKDADGNVVAPHPQLSQVNYWSDLIVDAVAARLIQLFDTYPEMDNYGVGVEDNPYCPQYPEYTEPFEYAPGQFVDPEHPSYYSTVYFTFMNKVARKVKEVHPDKTIVTMAYWLTKDFPLCEIEDNLLIIIAPIERCLRSTVYDTTNPYNKIVYDDMEGWKTVSNDIIIYNYYGCSNALHCYERPIWYTIQKDLHYYMESGFDGLMPQGPADIDVRAWSDGATRSGIWDMNMLTFWLYSKLAWNPDENIDDLIAYFCNKVYGEAADEMREYYRLILTGWEEAEDAPNYFWNFKLSEDSYFEVFVYNCDLEADILVTLRAAYDAAETDVIKERIRPIKESYEAAFPEN